MYSPYTKYFTFYYYYITNQRKGGEEKKNQPEKKRLGEILKPLYFSTRPPPLNAWTMAVSVSVLSPSNAPLFMRSADEALALANQVKNEKASLLLSCLRRNFN